MGMCNDKLQPADKLGSPELKKNSRIVHSSSELHYYYYNDFGVYSTHKDHGHQIADHVNEGVHDQGGEDLGAKDIKLTISN